MSQDMTVIRTKKGQKNSILIRLMFTLIIMGSFGSYSYTIAMALEPVGKVYVMLTMLLAGTTMLTLIEAIYKSQGILFNAKDTDMLFSLPIPKSYVLFVRMMKMIVFEIMYNGLFLLPAFVVYALYIDVTVYYIISAILTLILAPIIPTLLGTILGFFVKAISSKFKSKNLAQVVVSLLFVLVVMAVSMKSENIVDSIAKNADSVNNTIVSVYYPVLVFMNMVLHFNLLNIVIAILVNIVPLAIFTAVFGKLYFKATNLFGRKTSNKKLVITSKTFKRKSQLKALIHKEFRRFLGCPVLILNAYVGIAIVVVISVVATFNLDGLLDLFITTNENNEVMQENSIDVEVLGNEEQVQEYEIYNNMNKDEIKQNIVSMLDTVKAPIVYGIIVVTSFMTFITGSLISLEGKSFNVTKSLPISFNKILWGKILASDILVIIPLALASTILFIGFNFSILEILCVLGAVIIAPNLSAMWGLFVNLRHPKMEFSSDSEVVKQSYSIMVCSFSGILFALISMGFIIASTDRIMAMAIELGVYVVLSIILGLVLKTYGVKKFKEINV